MTCNPFTSAAAKNSVSIIRPENLDFLDFDALLDFEQNLASRFDREDLREATRQLNTILRETDLTNHAVLKDKLEQSPINSEELAEFLINNATNPDDVIETISKEEDRRATAIGVTKSIKNTIKTIVLVDYPSTNPPGIHKKVESYSKNGQPNLTSRFKGIIDENGKITGVLENAGAEVPYTGSGSGVTGINGNFKVTGSSDGNTFKGKITGGTYTPGFVIFDTNLKSADSNVGTNATFNVVIGSNGLPIITVANPGSGYNAGDQVVLQDLDITVSVQTTADQIIAPGAITVVADPAQDYVNLVSNLDFFFNENYGSAISSGACGSTFLNMISGLFDFFSGLSNFQIQMSSLTDIWNRIEAFPLSVPSLLSALKTTFTKIIDNIVAKALQTVENVKKTISNIGASATALIKEISDVERFFADENKNKVKNLADSIIQKMHDQFKNPSFELIVWMLTRLCQLSSFINDFLQAPLNKLTSLVSLNGVVKNSMANITNISISKAVKAGAVRLNRTQLVQQAEAATKRSNDAGKSGRTATNRTPSRITAFPISDQDRVRVVNEVSEDGWQGFFTFAPSVKNNNYGPSWGDRFEGAGWRVIVRDNPVLFAKVQKIIEDLGDGPYVINSAFRSEEYNSKISGAAKRSAHTEALALDIKMSVSQAIDFVPLASANGFNGIAYYIGSGFLHVDLRTYRQSPGDRSWNLGGLPTDLRNVINNHQNKLYSR